MRAQRIARPFDPGDELHVYIGVEHHCPEWHLLRQVEGREKAEQVGSAVVFPVGHYGQGMPAGVPFEVVTTEPCPACGKLLRRMFEWSAPQVFDFGAAS